MIYLTLGDPPTGVYSSQVIDVCRHLKSELRVNIRLIAIISVRSFFKNRKKIKNMLPGSIVLPMAPGLGLWKLNILLLAIMAMFFDFRQVIARGPLAANLAIYLKKMGLVKKMCFDCRAAYGAEINEYNVLNNKRLLSKIFRIESNAINKSDIRLAVSNALVRYWRENYSYKEDREVVIPGTLSSGFMENLPGEKDINGVREEFTVQPHEILFVYSGSSAGWQSFSLINEFLSGLMRKDERIKALILAEGNPKALPILQEYPERALQKWVQPVEAFEILCACDYGIMLREQSVTNQVAAPVKFAEYLAAGLQIIISKNLGDYSDFVEKNDCGYVISEPNKISFPLERTENNTKERIRQLARANFTKDGHKDEYLSIIKQLAG